MTTTRLRRRLAGSLLTAGLLAGLSVPAAPAAAAEPACGAAATANAKWVQFVYGKILGRCAEPSAEAHWVGLLTSGKAKRTDVSRRIDLSTENLVNHNVVPLYEEIVGRTPGAAEISHWVGVIRRTQEDARLVSLLTASDEFFGKAPLPEVCGFGGESGVTIPATTPEQVFVVNAYCSSVDREPTQAELDAGVTAIGSPSTLAKRFAFVLSLKYSEENAASWVGGVYGYGLQRGPSEAEVGVGIPYLINVLKWRTFELYTRVLASDEAFALAQQPAGPPPAVRKGDAASLQGYLRTH